MFTDDARSIFPATSRVHFVDLSALVDKKKKDGPDGIYAKRKNESHIGSKRERERAGGEVARITHEIARFHTHREF